MEQFLGLFPDGALYNGLVLTWMACALVTDLTYIDRVAQQRIQGAARE